VLRSQALETPQLGFRELKTNLTWLSFCNLLRNPLNLTWLCTKASWNLLRNPVDRFSGSLLTWPGAPLAHALGEKNDNCDHDNHKKNDDDDTTDDDDDDDVDGDNDLGDHHDRDDGAYDHDHNLKGVE